MVLPCVPIAGARAGVVVVRVTAGKPTEGAFELSRTTVPIGTVVFTVVNRGRLAHVFAIAGKRTASIPPGKSASLTLLFAKAKTYHGGFGTLAVLAPAASTGRSPPTISTTAGTQPAAVVRESCANPTASTVKVAIFDFGFTLSQSSVPCGSVTFQITNTGAIQHNFDVQIPFNGIAAFSGGLNLLGGESATETLSYTKTGPYAYQCDLHWVQGQMLGTLTVTQSP
jgi:plastocyanin